MARVVSGPGGQLRFANLQWGMAMKLARDAGWQPQGTLEPAQWGERPAKEGAPREWPRFNYFSKAGQRVTDEDAAAIADALDSVLPDIPDHDALAHKVGSTIDMPNLPPLRALRSGSKVNAFEFFSGASKELLRRFVALCRAGGFSIT